MMRRTSVALIALGLLVTACTSSRVDPKADITLSGTVLRQGGTPVSGARVALQREGDAGDVFLVVASLGLTCIDSENAPAICERSRFASTGSNGTFTYKIKGKDTQSTFGFSAVLNLTTGIPPNEEEELGSNTTYRFHVQTESLNLPLRLWEPRLAARTGPAFGARVAFPKVSRTLLPRQLLSGGIDYAIEFDRGTETVWRIDRAQPIQRFDPRLLEDSAGTLRVLAQAENLHVSETLGDEVAFMLRSGTRPYESPIGAPFSRGKTCGLIDDKGKLYPISSCGLTDGSFKSEFNPSVCNGATGCIEPAHASAYIDLRQRVVPSLIVVRGCSSGCRVETSPDGRTWRLAGVAQESSLTAIRVSASRPTRYVRAVASPFPRIAEISVWVGDAVVPDANLLVTPQRFTSPPPGNATRPPVASKPTKDSRFNFWALIAAMLLGAVASLGVLFVIRRRSGRPI